MDDWIVEGGWEVFKKCTNSRCSMSDLWCPDPEEAELSSGQPRTTLHSERGLKISQGIVRPPDKDLSLIFATEARSGQQKPEVHINPD
jgi:hypothetical protein